MLTFRLDRDVRGSSLQPPAAQAKAVAYKEAQRERADFYQDLDETAGGGHNDKVFGEKSAVHTWKGKAGEQQSGVSHEGPVPNARD